MHSCVTSKNVKWCHLIWPNVHPCQSVIKILKCLYCLNCPKFGQLSMMKIIRILATRCQIFGVKVFKIRFRSTPETPFGELTASPDSLAAFKGALLLRGGDGNEREGKRRRKGGSKKEFAPQSSPRIDATDSN